MTPEGRKDEEPEMVKLDGQVVAVVRRNACTRIALARTMAGEAAAERTVGYYYRILGKIERSDTIRVTRSLAERLAAALDVTDINSLRAWRESNPQP